MLLLLPIATSVLFAFLFIFMLLRNTRNKALIESMSEIQKLLEDENKILLEEKILLSKKLERIDVELEHNKKMIAEFDKMRSDSQNSTKAALFDLGNELSKQLIDMHKKENLELRQASEQRIKEAADKFNSEFERIVAMVGSLNKEIGQSRSTVDLIKNSLLSPSGAGRLAEITLENLLKNSGLRKGVDFSLQHQTVDNDNRKLRPDAVIFMPGDNLMVIDSKTSKYLVESAEEEGGNTELARSMNMHLKSLLSKDYGQAVLNSIDRHQVSMVITLMFLPTEHAVEKIMEADPEFLNRAWSNNIFPVGPAGLMNMLSFAKFQITEQLMFENHKMIIEEVKKLLASVASMTEHGMRLGANIQSVVNNYDKFAASFNRNFLSRARAMAKLGIDLGEKKISRPLTRYQIVSSSSELVELEVEEISSLNDPKEINGQKKLEKIG